MTTDHIPDFETLFQDMNFDDFVKIVTDYAWKGFKRGEKVGAEEITSEYTPREEQNPFTLDSIRAKQILLSEKSRARLTGDLRKALLEGSSNRESLHQMKSRIGDVFVDFQEYETERVIRTEIIGATNQGRNDSWNKNSAVQWKVWHNGNISSKRTANDSKRMYGQIQKKDEPFIDPMTNKSFMMPPMRPNDRCTALPLTTLPDSITYIAGQMYDESKVQKEARKYK